MSSRRTADGADKIYDAAQAWVDSALRSDGSLFTPGKRIWTLEGLAKLRTQFLDRPDGSSDKFYVKLKRQLEGSPPEVYQLMAEVLFVHFLISGNMKGDTKRASINQVLGWSSDPASIPQPLANSLDIWFMRTRSINIDAQVGTQIEVVEQWKQLQPEERTRILEDAWAFKEFLLSRQFTSQMLVNNQNTGQIEKEMLLHIAFPDVFETIVIDRKRRIAAAAGFADFVTEPTDDVDRKLQQIRQGITVTRGGFDHFWEPGIMKVWAEGQPLNGAVDNGTNEETEPEIDRTADLAASLYLPADALKNIVTLLDEKKQIIFQGPPGTGKTYVAQALAEHLAGSSGRVTLVQLHPSYSYEDFVQGYRPTLRDGQPGFELRDGPLLRAAEQARQNLNANHYLIIDEINRGNIANVFGELYFLLEYRDKEIRLQYDDKSFTLPPNLYIIGTMNTADRSIALVDLALRRRFYFVEFHPDIEPVKSVLRKFLQDKRPEMLWIADVVEAANAKLREDRHAAIGPSYFMRDGLDNEAVERIWKHSVLPYIEERRFGGDTVADEFSLNSLRREVNQNLAQSDIADVTVDHGEDAAASED